MQWPHCCNIVDYIRCCVTFDDIDSFLKGFYQFISDFKFDYPDRNQSDNYKNRCVKFIVRIKNDFSSIKDNAWDENVDSFNYCDVKCNVLIECYQYRLIGEIQFY